MSRTAPGKKERSRERKRQWQREQGGQEGMLEPLMINQPAPWFPQQLVLVLGNYPSLSLNRTRAASCCPTTQNRNGNQRSRWRRVWRILWFKPGSWKTFYFQLLGLLPVPHHQPSAACGHCLRRRKLPEQNHLSFASGPTSNSGIKALPMAPLQFHPIFLTPIWLAEASAKTTPQPTPPSA